MDPNEASEMVTGLFETAGNLLVEYGLSVIGAIVVLVIGRAIAGWARSKLQSSLTKAGTDASLIPFFSSMIYYVILGVVLIAVLLVGVVAPRRRVDHIAEELEDDLLQLGRQPERLLDLPRLPVLRVQAPQRVHR